MTETKTSPIAILGAGTWGLSTALHLTNAGYTNITVFDKAAEIPSQYSAGYDLNKIVRPEYEDPFYTELALVSHMYVYEPYEAKLRFLVRKALRAGERLCLARTITKPAMWWPPLDERPKRPGSTYVRRWRR